MESLSDVIEVAGVKSSDGNTTIGSHVNSVLLAKFVDLLLVEAGEGEHANLVDHVLPRVLAAEVLEVLDQSVTHLHHTA